MWNEQGETMKFLYCVGSFAQRRTDIKKEIWIVPDVCYNSIPVVFIVSEINNFAYRRMRPDFVRKYAAFSGQNPAQ